MSENVLVPEAGKQQQILAVKISMYGSIILFLIAATVGITVDSITLILDASSSLVIFLVAFLMHFSIKMVHRPPDDFYNFGYGKYEPLTVAVQSVLTIATCIVCIKFAIQDIVHPDDVEGYGLPVLATFLSAIIGLLITLYLKRIARDTNSHILKAAGLHWLADTLLSLGLCIGFSAGFLLQRHGYNKITPYVDPVMSILLAVFFVQLPFRNISRDIFELLDAVPTQNIRSKVKEIIEQYKPKYFGVNRLRVRKAGEKIFVDVCFIVKDGMTISEAEEISSGLEKDLRQHLTHCDVVVYFKPILKPGKEKV